MLTVLEIIIFLVKQFAKFGGKLTQKKIDFLLSKFGHLITIYKLENVLYKLGTSNVTNESFISSNTSANLWHEMLRHISQ
jgi:hypothetical protein